MSRPPHAPPPGAGHAFDRAAEAIDRAARRPAPYVAAADVPAHVRQGFDRAVMSPIGAASAQAIFGEPHPALAPVVSPRSRRLKP